MDTKERKRRPPTEKPKAKPPARGNSRAKQGSAKTADRADTKRQTQRRKTSQTKQKRSIAEDVVYLPPKPFSRKRLLLRLATVVAVVFALVFSRGNFGSLRYSGG